MVVCSLERDRFIEVQNRLRDNRERRVFVRAKRVVSCRLAVAKQPESFLLRVGIPLTVSGFGIDQDLQLLGGRFPAEHEAPAKSDPARIRRPALVHHSFSKVAGSLDEGDVVL